MRPLTYNFVGPLLGREPDLPFWPGFLSSRLYGSIRWAFHSLALVLADKYYFIFITFYQLEYPSFPFWWLCSPLYCTPPGRRGIPYWTVVPSIYPVPRPGPPLYWGY